MAQQAVQTPKALAERLIAYLQTRPYQEVAELLSEYLKQSRLVNIRLEDDPEVVQFPAGEAPHNED